MKIRNSFSLISCICVTKHRPELLLRSIQSFREQTYTNKELIVSYLKEDTATIEILSSVADLPDFKMITVCRSIEDSLGTARNCAIRNACGEYICSWDDDDLHHPLRLEEQMKFLLANRRKGVAACVLTQILFYHLQTKTAYLSFPAYWTCSLIVKKSVSQNYPCADRDEFEMKPLLDHLISSNNVLQMNVNAALYTFVYHGQNTMKFILFLQLLNRCYPIPNSISSDITTYLGIPLSDNGDI